MDEEFNEEPVESDLHDEKQDLQRILTEEGIQIDLSDEQDENADCPIRLNVQADSHLNVESDLHEEKHDLQRI
jgi:hypothetical protein